MIASCYHKIKKKSTQIVSENNCTHVPASFRSTFPSVFSVVCIHLGQQLRTDFFGIDEALMFHVLYRQCKSTFA